MKMKALVNGEVCVKGEVLYGDVILLDGKIFDVVDPGKYPSDKELELIDCKGQLILPGLIDIGCGVCEEKVAIASGVTTQICIEDLGKKPKIVCEWGDDLTNICEEGNVHFARVSKEADLDVIKEYKDKGVTCDVALHSLVLNEDDKDYMEDFVGAKPDLAERSELFALWKALKFEEIDMIVSAHEKFFPAVEWFLPIMLNAVNDEGLSMGEVVKLCCENPAEIFGIKKKGKIEVGYDADLVVVDMDLEKKVEKKSVISKSSWSPYAGSVFKGWPVKVFVGGQIAWQA